MANLLVPILFCTLVASILLTGCVRNTVLKRESLLDMPNERSSHTTPTPRGGGIVFATLFLVTIALYLANSIPGSDLWIGLLGGGALVALVGWLDDWRGLPSSLRLGLYAIASAWASAWIGGLPELSLGFAEVRLGLAGYVISWAAILAFTNIYNFMDGIDGLAGSEGLTVSVAAGALLIASGDLYLGWLLIGLACALLGLLRWNWSPARIFMGDVGSNLLGFTFATLALASERFTHISIWVWGILLGVFIVDGLLTFGRRLIRRLPPHQAHRSHAYQGAVQRGYSHGLVSLVVVGINVLLAGVATAAWFWPSGAVLLCLLSCMGLAAIHMHYSPLKSR